MDCLLVVRRWIRAFERVQVELHGQYSIERMTAFGHYAEHASYWRVTFVLLLVPLPCLVVIVLVDLIPLQDPALGLKRSALFWVRSAIMSFCMSFMVLEQCRHYVPKLRMSLALVLTMTLVTTIATTLTDIGMAYAIGYPMPFAILATVPTRLTVFVIWFYLKYRNAFRADPTILRELMTYLYGLMAQTSLILIYPLINFVFLNLDSTGQTVLTLALPAIKLGAKNWISHAYAHLEDLKPEMVIFNVELFHALFLSCCMQSSASGYPLVLLIVFDYAQAGLSLLDLRTVLQRIAELQSSVRAELPTVLANAPGHTMKVQSALHLLRIDTFLSRHPSVISAARLEMLQAIRDRDVRPQMTRLAAVARMQLVAKKFHRVTPAPKLLDVAGSLANTPRAKTVTRAMWKASAKAAALSAGTAHVAGGAALLSAAADTAGPSATAVDSTKAGPHRAAVTDSMALTAASADRSLDKPKYVQQVLHLLHLAEFALMIEFTEVLIPVIYSMYILVSYNLSNRRFYTQFTASTDVDVIEDNIAMVLRYAALELLSFVVISFAVWQRIRYSALHQIAFVLETQWPLVQTKIIVWVLFTVQLQLYHFGAGCSFV